MFIKPVDMATLSVFPDSVPDLPTYLNELLTTNKPEEQNNTFWFPTLENPGRTEDQTTIETRILGELLELKANEKLSPQENTKTPINFPKRFHWINTLLTEAEKQAIEDNLVEYHDIFARHYWILR